MAKFEDSKEHEDYLFKVVNRVIEWLGMEIITGKRYQGLGKVHAEEISNLVMLELINYK